MGRKSPLTPEQWLEVERRHLVDGESIRSLAKAYGVDEAAIRRRINPQKSAPGTASKSLRDLAENKIKADSAVRDISAEISALSPARQVIVNDLCRKLSNISQHLASAAEYGAMTAHRLSGIAHAQVELIDDSAPLKSMDTLKEVAVLTKMANESSSIALNLLSANKKAVESMNSPQDDDAPTFDAFFRRISNQSSAG